MEDTLYDLLIDYIDVSKLQDMSHVCAAVVTRSQAKQNEKKYGKLKVHCILSICNIYFFPFWF